jgi:hypothetical protein
MWRIMFIKRTTITNYRLLLLVLFPRSKEILFLKFIKVELNK